MSFARTSFAARAARIGAAFAVFALAAHCSSSSSKGLPTTTTTVGALGGTIQSADGVFDLVIPPGALSGDVVLNVISQTSQNEGAVGTAYTVSPYVGLQAPVQAVFHYNLMSLGSVAPSSLVVGIFGGSWSEIGDHLYTPASQTISGTSESLSLFGLIPPPSTDAGTAIEDAGAVDNDAAGGCYGSLTAAVGSSDCTISEICLNDDKYEIDCNPLSGLCTCSLNGADTTTADASCSVLGASSLALCGFPVGNISTIGTGTGTGGSDSGNTCAFQVFPFEDAGDGGGTCGVTETCGVSDRYEIVCDGSGNCQCSDNGVPGPTATVSCTGISSAAIAKCFYPAP